MYSDTDLIRLQAMEVEFLAAKKRIEKLEEELRDSRATAFELVNIVVTKAQHQLLNNPQSTLGKMLLVIASELGQKL